MTCAYAVISGQIDYQHRQSEVTNKAKYEYFNVIVYMAMLSVCFLAQSTAYLLTIRNWLVTIDKLRPQRYLRVFIAMPYPIIAINVGLLVLFTILVYLNTP
jgi:hypothetical protein